MGVLEVLSALEEVALVTNRGDKSKKSLRILDGVDRGCTIRVPALNTETKLALYAERWTSRQPFKCVAEHLVG